MVAACGAEGISPANGDHSRVCLLKPSNISLSCRICSLLWISINTSSRKVFCGEATTDSTVAREETLLLPVFLRVNGHSSEPSIQPRSFNFDKNGSGRLWKRRTESEAQTEDKPWPINDGQNEKKKAKENRG